MHGIITRGGDQANIIPEHTASEFYLRAPTKDYCRELLRRFEGCAEGAATATGCTVKVTADAIIHDPLKANFAMAELFGKNLERIDFPVDPDDGEAGYGSTDCGNVEPGDPDDPSLYPHLAGRDPRAFARVRGVGQVPARAHRHGGGGQGAGDDRARPGGAAG